LINVTSTQHGSVNKSVNEGGGGVDVNKKVVFILAA
jgi:hypothetical protein